MTWHTNDPTMGRVTCDASDCPAVVARPACGGYWCASIDACIDASNAALRAGWRVPFDAASPDLCPSHADTQLPLPGQTKGLLSQ